MSHLPTDAKERKGLPIGTGFLDYFPLAIAEASKASVAGNSQHMPGDHLHWDPQISKDNEDALIRHYIDRYEIDKDGVAECGKMVWRAAAVAELILRGRTRQIKVTKWVNVYLATPTVSDPACVRYGQGAIYDTKESALDALSYPSPGYIGTFPIDILR